MSTGLNCVMIEEKPGRWHYVLEDYGAPKNAFSWMEYATAYGPFQTEAKAADHLSDHHANPGGWFTVPHKEFKPTPTLERLLKESEANKKRIERHRFF